MFKFHYCSRCVSAHDFYCILVSQVVRTLYRIKCMVFPGIVCYGIPEGCIYSSLSCYGMGAERVNLGNDGCIKPPVYSLNCCPEAGQSGSNYDYVM